MRRVLRMLAVVVASASLLVLTGCAMPRMIDSDVQSFTTGAVAPATYRFERLPSQAAAAQQDQLESMATVALAKVGLTKGTTEPHYMVQAVVVISTIQPSYPAPMAAGFWRHRDEHRMAGLGLMLEPNGYRHTVNLLLRDIASGKVVYETSATFDGPWSDSTNLLPAILDAALQGYPQPPSGPRKVVIELAPSDAQTD